MTGLKLGALALACSLLIGVAAEAGTVIVSGDTNIANGIDGSSLTPMGDNGIFFSNVLGTGTQVLIQDDGGFKAAPIATWYDNLAAGIVTTTIAAAPTAAQLATVDLFIDIRPDVTYDGATIAALLDLLERGGTVFFIGDNVVSNAENTVINTDLLALGSTMQIVLSLSSSSLDAVGQFGIPQSDPLTAGVAQLGNVSGSEVSGGIPLFLAGDGSDRPFVAYETLPVVPEPATLALLGAGLLGLGALRRAR